MIELMTVLHRGVVDLGRKPARPHQGRGILPLPLAGALDLDGRLARGGTLAAGDHEAEVVLQTTHRLLDRAAGRGRDPAGLPVEAEHAAKGLEPERVGQPLQHLARAIVGDHVAQDLAREVYHAPEQPSRRPAAVQRQHRQPDAAGARAHVMRLRRVRFALIAQNGSLIIG